MAATPRRAAAVILIAAVILAGGCRPAASGTSLANATPHAPPTAPMTRSDGEPVDPMASEVRFVSRDVMETLCPRFP
jgi:hypothetical protein